MATLEDIRAYLQANPGMTDQQIVAAMNQYGVSPLQMAQATSMPIEDIQSRYDAANQQLQSQPILDRASEILAGGGTPYDIAREAKVAGLSAADLAQASGMSEEDIVRLSGGILDGSNIPSRPTFSGVASEWNATHKDRFGEYLNLATASQENVQNQIKQLQDETKRRQDEWDQLYGDTPEGRIIKENPPPDWRQVYEQWVPTHIERFGNIVNRPWSADDAAINQKKELDEKYIQAINDYNQKYGTNITPDPYAVGTFAQPSEVYQEPEEDEWYENPLNVAAALAAIYFGGQYLLGELGAAGTAAAGEGALGTGLTAGAGGTTGLTAGAGGVTGLTAPAGFTLAPELGATLATLGGSQVLPGSGAEVFPLGETSAPSITSIPGGAESVAPIIDRSFPFDPSAYDAISTTEGLSNLAKAGLETIAQNPMQSLRTANTLSNLYNLATGGNSGGLFGGMNKDTANMLSQGLSMLQPGASQYTLPGTLESTYLPPVAGATNQQLNFLAQLKQLYPELKGTDDRLLSTIAERTGVQAAKGGHIPEFITGATGHYVQGRGDGQSDDIPAMLADGEYVFDADTVAALGNGSNKAGAAVLDEMRKNIRKHKRSASHDKIPPKAKSPLEYLKG